MKRSLTDFGVEENQKGSLLWVGRWILAPLLVVYALGYLLAFVGAFGDWVGIW